MTYFVAATVNAQGVTDGRMQTLRNVRDALPGVALAGLQEVTPLRGDWSLRERLSRKTIGVLQKTRTKGTSGVALVWDKSRVRMIEGSDRIAVGTHPEGVRMLTRYILAADFVIDGRLIVTAVVWHRPKWAYRHLWPAFDAACLALVEQARHPVIVFTDNNSRSIPTALRPVLRAFARRIDMVLLSQQLRAIGQAFDLPRTGSDHLPVGLRVAIPGSRR